MFSMFSVAVLDAIHQTLEELDADGESQYAIHIKLFEELASILPVKGKGIEELLRESKERQEEGFFSITVPTSVGLRLLENYWEVYKADTKKKIRDDIMQKVCPEIFPNTLIH